MGSKLIDIPAGAAAHPVTDVYELPVPVDLMGVYPHAHFLGREMLVTATLPGGEQRTLLHIPHWSFHWQQDYRYVTPIALPRGTRIEMRYTYDNSDGNPHNPSSPPVRVRAGPKSTDEMAELGLQVLPKSAGDAALLIRAFEERELHANVALAESRVREEPNVASYRALLGTTLVDAGRFAEAVPHLEAAVRLGGRTPGTCNALGMALMALGRLEAAAAEFRRGIALDPRDENLHFNLGNALGRLERPDEAAAAYRQSIAINPDLPDPHINLGLLYFSRGQVGRALPHFARAVELRPDSAVTHSNYGGALAAAGRYQEALQATRRALAIDPAHAPALDNLRRLERIARSRK
jgi:Flp pilus assembly protein TadD